MGGVALEGENKNVNHGPSQKWLYFTFYVFADKKCVSNNFLIKEVLDFKVPLNGLLLNLYTEKNITYFRTNCS